MVCIEKYLWDGIGAERRTMGKKREDNEKDWLPFVGVLQGGMEAGRGGILW